MPHYPILEPREIIMVLSKRGFRFKSQRGSHAKYTNGRHTTTIPMKKTVSAGTLKSILKQVDMTLEEFMKYL